MIGNPVITRELRGALRSKRTLVLGAAALILMAAMVAWLWPESGVFSLQAQAARALVSAFAVALTAMALLYAPAFSSTALVWEKQNRSWELLLASRLSPWHIVSGKLMATSGLLLMFMALTFPFLAAAFALGALSVQEALSLYAVTMLTALCAGVIGLVISACSRNTQSALIRAFVFMSAWAGLPLVLHFLLRGQPGLAENAARIQAISPVAAALSALSEPIGRTAGHPGWIIFLMITGGFGALLFLGLVIALYRRPSNPRFGTAKVIDDSAELSRRRRRFPFYLIDPQRRRRGISNWVNPVFARELRGRAFGGGAWIFRAMVACFCVSALLVFLLVRQGLSQSPDGIKGFAMAFQLALILLVAPALTCGAVSQERESGQLDMLRLSRTGPGSLLLGKAGVALLFVAMLIIACLPLWLIITVMKMNTGDELLRAAAVIVSALALSLFSGLAASACARRTAIAAGLAYGLLFCIAVLTLMPFLAPDRFTPALANTFMQTNPFLTAYGVLRVDENALPITAWLSYLKFTLTLTLTLGAIAYARTRHLFSTKA